MKDIINFLVQKEGVTLMEVVVAISILMIILIPLSSFYINSVYFIETMELKEKALILAHNEMEILKVKQFSDISVGITTRKLTLGDTVFTGKINIENYTSEIKEIKIRVFNDNKKLAYLKHRLIR